MSTPDETIGRPSLLVTVDAEGDNLWGRPRTVTTENARFLPRFQDLCERYGLRPTYLATFEMARCARFQEFANAVLRRDEAEIGMHLHAWNSPPEVPLTADDHRYQPHLTHYSDDVMREKVASLTHILEETFERPIRSHRGGRWAFNETYARILVESNYWIDSSVTPHVSWQRRTGHPFDTQGPDYSRFPQAPYFLDLDDIRRPGSSRLLEVPVTTCRISFGDENCAPVGTASYFVRWLRPNGRNGKALLGVAKQALAERRECLVLMLHSSELMAGGSPAIRQPEDVEAVYRDLEELFRVVAASVRGRTLTEFYRERVGRHPRPPASET